MALLHLMDFPCLLSKVLGPVSIRLITFVQSSNRTLTRTGSQKVVYPRNQMGQVRVGNPILSLGQL